MTILARVGAAIHDLLGATAESTARRHGLIQRQRKFSATTLLRTFVLGFLKNPRASDEHLARTAAECGVSVTPQAVAQRQTPALVRWLHDLFEQAARTVLGSDRILAPLLERFPGVYILDGSTVTLPDGQADRFPGCGGSYAASRAALKLQTELDLRSGSVTVAVEAGKSPDGATPRPHEPHARGSLVIRDLGYFCLQTYALVMAARGHFLSRLQYNTTVRGPGHDATTGRPARRFLAWLAAQTGSVVDQWVDVGAGPDLRCRLLAWRVPAGVANERRRKLRATTRKKKGREPSAARLAWCDWTVLVTSVPSSRLTVAEAAVLFRARWQVELLFKRWKSQNLIAALTGATEVRQMVRVWARLLMSLVQHWLLQATVWGDPSKSLTKASQAIQEFASRLIAAQTSRAALARAIAELARLLASTCRRNRRSNAGTFELLNNPGLLDLRLT